MQISHNVTIYLLLIWILIEFVQHVTVQMQRSRTYRSSLSLCVCVTLFWLYVHITLTWTPAIPSKPFCKFAQRDSNVEHLNEKLIHTERQIHSREELSRDTIAIWKKSNSIFYINKRENELHGCSQAQCCTYVIHNTIQLGKVLCSASSNTYVATLWVRSYKTHCFYVRCASISCAYCNYKPHVNFIFGFYLILISGFIWTNHRRKKHDTCTHLCMNSFLCNIFRWNIVFQFLFLNVDSWSRSIQNWLQHVYYSRKMRFWLIRISARGLIEWTVSSDWFLCHLLPFNNVSSPN